MQDYNADQTLTKEKHAARLLIFWKVAAQHAHYIILSKSQWKQAMLARYTALSTKLWGLVAIWCEVWRNRTGLIS